MNFSAPVPIFRIFDVAKAKEFYVGFLGFKVDWEHTFEANTPVYMQITLGDCRMHLSEHHGDACPGANARIECHELERYHQELLAKGYKYNRPGMVVTEWRTREVVVNDPFGNRIVFYDRQVPAPA